ncbi:MAG: DUF1801 domain-containing protein [Candidatus Pacebacteria bacterium]|nr:DUF1801 domain-containing protein [Candidatus Paceibacterota bacterium]
MKKTSTKTSISTIDQYIKQFPKDVQPKLKELRDVIKKAAPKATETISYGIPTFKQNGNLVHFGGFKSHIGFFPGADGVAAFSKDFAGYKQSKGTIQFPLDAKMPFTLVRKVVKYRIKQNTALIKAK